MNIGIFGGTFDPFTSAHYEIVKKVLVDKLVDKVIVIPTIVDYYRADKQVLFNKRQRSTILKKWLCNFDPDEVWIDFHEYSLFENAQKIDCENSMKDRRYLHMLKDVIKRNGSNNTYFTIIGGDSWNNLDKWYKWEELFEISSFIVVCRDETCLRQLFTSGISCYKPSHIISIDKKFGNVSATNIRNKLQTAISGMSLGPSTTCLDIYLEEIAEYLKSRKDIDNTVIAHTPIFDLIRKDEILPGFRPVGIVAPEWASVIVEKDNKFLMVRQLRYGIMQECDEFPCGQVEKGENPCYAARRELAEETGINLSKGVSDLIYLGKFAANPAFMSNYMHYFYVNLDVAKWTQDVQHLDEHEQLQLFWKDKQKVVDDYLNSNSSVFMAGAILRLLDKMNNGVKL